MFYVCKVDPVTFCAHVLMSKGLLANSQTAFVFL